LSATAAPVRRVALVENDSSRVCVNVDLNGNVTAVAATLPEGTMAPIDAACDQAAPGSIPFGPAMTLLGNVDANGYPVTQEWIDPISQVMNQGQVEQWEIYNFTQDAHPMHLHGTRFRAISRQMLTPDATNPLLAAKPVSLVAATSRAAENNEAGYKDVVVVNPREVTRLLARFDRNGLYNWHCHIVEHEDNEMMLPMCVRAPGDSGSECLNPATPDGLPALSPPVKISAGL
jgi:FtsP/CotA-like multicopper oxidase with cupredoxin domain